MNATHALAQAHGSRQLAPCPCCPRLRPCNGMAVRCNASDVRWSTMHAHASKVNACATERYRPGRRGRVAVKLRYFVQQAAHAAMSCTGWRAVCVRVGDGAELLRSTPRSRTKLQTAKQLTASCPNQGFVVRTGASSHRHWNSDFHDVCGRCHRAAYNKQHVKGNGNRQLAGKDAESCLGGPAHCADATACSACRDCNMAT